MILDDQSIMPFGKHRGKKMEMVSADYLLWFRDSVMNDGGSNLDEKGRAVFQYVEDNYKVLAEQNRDYIIQNPKR